LHAKVSLCHAHILDACVGSIAVDITLITVIAGYLQSQSNGQLSIAGSPKSVFLTVSPSLTSDGTNQVEARVGVFAA
jgi:hypothetical protein